MFIHRLAKLVLLSCTCILGHSVRVAAQSDTLQLDLKQAEQLFFQKNLQLIAAHYSVKADSALIQQARLWDNPDLVTDQNIYSNNRWFEHGTNPDGSPQGQYYVQLQFLIKTAGKRGKQISLAKTNANISQWQFNNLMAQLKAQLRTDFFTLVQLQVTTSLLQAELDQTDKLITSMGQQFSAGNIARKDLLRIQALQIGLKQDMVENARQIEDVQSELRTMLQLAGDQYIKPQLPNNATLAMPGENLEQLVSMAKTYNPAYQLQKLQVTFQEQNLSLQKALAAPDVSLGPNYDHNSNYTPHYVGLGISLPVPVFNRNQGNIRSARFQVQQEEANMQYADVQLQNDVLSAWRKLQLLLQPNTTGQLQDNFYGDYDTLYQNIIESYRQRQISLVEFIDYFDAYKEIRQRQAQQQLNIRLAKEELNLKVGRDLE
jgi:cobalt-zinc-cadmium efflux system outer membrane protein